jgi:tRNA threonylcarbamoyladenosine biosynthesis protein TsaE
MVENLKIRLQGAILTRNCGVSLASSLYTKGMTILLTGDLGAGKTTFLQGFAKGLGIQQDLCSPTYALEQRYKTEQWGELLHIDLYRLSKDAAHELIESSEGHEGIRCIEWADRLHMPPSDPLITIHFAEKGREEREASFAFHDITLPMAAQVHTWRKELKLTKHVIAHCDKVGEVAEQLAQVFLAQGKIARAAALMRAGQLHDLFRFLDFHPGSAHLNTDITAEQQAHWESLRSGYNGASHESACTAFLRERGFPAIAQIVETHGLRGAAPVTTEQKLLFYADKRVILDRVVSLHERFEDFAVRYGNGKKSAQSLAWLKECERIERELFPEGPPDL